MTGRGSNLTGTFVAILTAAILACALYAAPLLHTGQSPQGGTFTAGSVQTTANGPWGRLEEIRINTEPPEEFVSEKFRYGTSRWVFPNYNREQLVKLFAATGLTKVQQQSLWSKGQEPPLGGGWVFYPDAEFLLGLTPQTRKNLYLELGEFEQNAAQYDPFRWRADVLDEWFVNGGLSGETCSLVKRLLYFRGKAALFADPELVLATLKKAQDRVQFLKTMSRQSTLLVKLIIQPDTNIDKLADYWGRYGRSKDVHALLDSLTKVPGGCSLDIVHLLPRFARQRLYTYPVLAKGFVDTIYDCHWTSLNFWNDPPDDRLGPDKDYSREVLKRDYVPVTAPYVLGDLLFFTTGAKDAIHSAAYVADDIVFTKNGPSITSPWILMKLPRVIAYYENQDDDLQILAYRRKD